jgi:hypothetical protein
MDWNTREAYGLFAYKLKFLRIYMIGRPGRNDYLHLELRNFTFCKCKTTFLLFQNANEHLDVKEFERILA